MTDIPHDSPIHIAIDVLASVAGSFACIYTGQPFDTVKVRMQTSVVGEYSSTFECFWRVLKTEGIVALWRGSVPAFLGAISENAVCFGMNGHLTRIVDGQKNIPKSVEPFVIGSLTGVCTSFALAPFDLVKSRAQVNRGSTAGAYTTIIKQVMTSPRGPAMLYSGIVAMTQCSALFYMSFFGSYSLLCRELKQMDNFSDSVVYFVSGGLAGQIAWAISLPLDIVKTRIQVAHDNPPRIRDVVKELYKAGGVRAFYRGIEATIIRAFPANAALFLAYEWTKSALAFNV